MIITRWVSSPRFFVKRFTSVELFAGAGGLALGLQRAGFNAQALVERDRHCCATLRRNAARYFPRTRIVQADIQRLTVPAFKQRSGINGRIDLVSGGPPCQSFSISKIPKGGRVRDPRDEMLWHFARFVRKLEPRAFLFENVPGLLSRSNGRIFRDLMKYLRSIGYIPTVGILNAADFGVPQIRKRLFVAGCSKGHTIDFPAPTHSPTGEEGLPLHVSIEETLSRVGRRIPNHRLPNNTREKRKLLAKMTPGSQWKHWRHRDKWNGPSRCLTAHCRDEWVHPLEPRAASVRELAALQTFPNQYIFCGPVNSSNNSPDSFQYRQVGNAVPVRMAKVLGMTIAAHLTEC